MMPGMNEEALAQELMVFGMELAEVSSKLVSMASGGEIDSGRFCELVRLVDDADERIRDLYFRHQLSGFD